MSKNVGKTDELIPKENRPREYYYINDCGDGDGMGIYLRDQ